MLDRGLAGPALVALGAVGLLLFSRSGDYVDDWRPVAEPLDLAEPALTVATFRARPYARYRLGLEVDWEGPAECLLGVRRSSDEPPCETESELRVEWAVRANGAELSRGDPSTYAGSSWGGASGVAALLGSFVAGPEENDHEVSLRVLTPASSPRPPQPPTCGQHRGPGTKGRLRSSRVGEADRDGRAAAVGRRSDVGSLAQAARLLARSSTGPEGS